MNPEEETIRLEFSNAIEKYECLVMIYGTSTGGAIAGFMMKGLFVFFAVLLFCFLAGSTLLYFIYKERPWDKPDVFIISSGELKYRYYSREYDPDLTIEFAQITKLAYTNRRHNKKISIVYQSNGKEDYEVFTRDFFEDCGEKWEQLFEEVKKRIPPDAEVFIV